MAKSPSFQFYAQDFLTGVMYLTNEEKGIYITMLAKQWTDEKIPKKRLGFLVGIEWDSFSDELQEKFTDHGDYLINTRLELERVKKGEFIKKQSKNGSLGGRPKKKGEAVTPVNPNEETQTKPKPLKTLKPNESQKNPLEDEDEIEEEKENRKGIKKTGKKTHLVFPWNNDEFKKHWNTFKTYKKDEHNFKYKSIISEQAALKKLAEVSGGNETKAIKILLETIANGWKGFFELKTNKNEQSSKSNEEVFAGAMASETGRNFKFN